MPLKRAALGLLLLPVLAAGCGGGASADDGSAGGDQSSPQAVVTAAYEHLADGEFEQLCRLVLPESLERFRARDTDCQTYLSKQYDTDSRAELRDVEVDAAKVQANGDTAVIPEDAVTFDGRPSRDDDTTVARNDGRWWLTLDQD